MKNPPTVSSTTKTDQYTATSDSFTLPELSVRSTITAALRKREKSGREKERERQRETSRAEGGSS